jgi:hypothetical protein
MSKIFKIVLSVIVFSIMSWCSAQAALTCPDIATAIKQVGTTSLASATGKVGDWHYTGKAADGSTVDYYTTIQPTAVTANHQIQLLEPALTAPLTVGTPTDTSISCAYLGTATGAAPTFLPNYTSTIWNQVIVISSSGSAPPPLPPPPPPPPPPGQKVAVSIKITGDLANLGGQSVPVKLEGLTNYGPVTIAANGSAEAFATIDSGIYTSGPAYVIVSGSEYYLKSAGPFTVSNTSSTITLEYDKVPAGSGSVVFNVYNDRTLTGTPASSSQTLTFTSVLGPVATETFTLNSGTASQNYTLPNGVYTVTLTAPSGYNAVIPGTILVLTSSPFALNADYKYAGTYLYLSPANYNLLLSSKDSTINLGQGTLSYQCYYKPSVVAPYYERYNCGNNGDFEFPTTVRTVSGTQIHEDVLWALSTAMASQIERMELEFGHHPFTGMPNKFPDYHNDAPLYPASSIKVIGSGGINTLGDYLYENISPNYLLARCLQEGNIGCTLTGQGGVSGAFQIDSYTSTLKVANVGGYAMPFAVMPAQTYVIQTPGGPFDPGGHMNCDSGRDCSNFVGGVISSAFFDTTAYTPAWSYDNALNMLQTLQNSTTLPDALEYFSSILYNQGPTSLGGYGAPASNQLFFSSTDPSNLIKCATTNYAAEQTDVRFIGTCFWPINSFGGRYPFQLPDVNHNYLEMANTTPGGHFYQNSKLTWSEISAYLDLIGPSYYGFYDQYDIAQAKIAGQAAFNSLAGSGTTIDFQTQFPLVLNAIMESFPVYLSETCIPGQQGC